MKLLCSTANLLTTGQKTTASLNILLRRQIRLLTDKYIETETVKSNIRDSKCDGCALFTPSPSQKSIRIQVINFNGIRSKVRKLQDHIFHTNPDVILGTESKIDHSIDSRTIFPHDYDIARRDRTRRGGGVFIAAGNGNRLSPLLVGKAEDIEIVWSLVLFRDVDVAPMYFGAFYRPPKSPAHLVFRELHYSVAALREQVGHNELFYLGGDFNLGHICWERESLTAACRERGSSRALLEFANRHRLLQLVKEPTRSGALLDLLFTSHRSTNSRIIQGLSDHNIIQVDAIMDRNNQK